MKTVQLLSFLLLILFFNSCKKEELFSKVDDPLSKVKDYAKSHISSTEFVALDWDNATTYKKNGVVTLVKIQAKELPNNKRTLYVRVLQNGFQGNYFESNKIGNDVEIKTTSLDMNRVGVAKISNNVFDGTYKVYENNTLVFDNTNSIVIVRAVPATYAYNYQTYYLTNPFLIGQPGGGSSSDPDYTTNFEYLPSDPNGGGSIEIIEIEYDDWDSKPGVDIQKMFNCFDLVPSGPSCVFTIKLNADIPVNSIPTFPINFLAEPGHAFISVTKTNGGQSVTQVFGFYPVSGPASLGLGNTPSKIVNDGGHEVNARISMNINEAGFNLMRANAIYWATLPYNIQSNNCADFAVNLFNVGRSNNPLVLPLYQPEVVIPGSGTWVTINVDKAPQTLFLTLDAMKTSGHPEAANILIDQTRGTTAAPSHGECP